MIKYSDLVSEVLQAAHPTENTERNEGIYPTDLALAKIETLNRLLIRRVPGLEFDDSVDMHAPIETDLFNAYGKSGLVKGPASARFMAQDCIAIIRSILNEVLGPEPKGR